MRHTIQNDIRIGLDTGGTYTDAVALNHQGHVVASAKSLTTHWDLSIGLGNAIRAVLAGLPKGAGRADISLVSVSTTLATNAVVENRFSPICTLLLGFDDNMVERSNLKNMEGCAVVRLRGGHDATGEELEPIDEAALDTAVAELGPTVEAFAVAGLFSVRNPAHERRVRDRIRSLSTRPVTCSHDLSSKLDAPQRALTAALNARLTPHIRHLIEALGRVLATESIAAPLMIVKGDGTLMRAEVALEYPVETILSGPAASIVGAGFLSGREDFAVSDMGGTTTDVAVVVGGRPVVSDEGAVVGGWRTMVEAVDVHTCGLGGDSEVYFDREQRLTVGPRKATPLSLLATQFPQIIGELRKIAETERPIPFSPQFAHRNPGRDPGTQLDRIEQRVWEELAEHPRPVGEVARTGPGVDALRRLVGRGLATIAAFTPSDAMHVLGKQKSWNAEAARLGAIILSTEERNATARKDRDTPENLCERTYQHVVRASARVILETALANDPGVEPKHGRWGPLSGLVDSVVEGRTFSRLVDARISLGTSLIAIGAPVGAYYPEVARRLGAELIVPEHAAVCNAVGAVAGVVSETSVVLVDQTTYNVFRVHDPDGSRDYPDATAAIEAATRISRGLAIAAAQRSGAKDPNVKTIVVERRAQAGTDADYLAEAAVRSTATGRPATGAG
jgi:N-methylhydantoinase A/oxoprolinase/acetone carboxylase beta subunit